jgi:cytochrome c biogenesis protein CcdA
MSTVEQKKTGKYFILGRFIGLIILGLIIASLGLIFDGYLTYLLVLFGVLTIVFGAVVILKLYFRMKNQKLDNLEANDTHLNPNQNSFGCNNEERYQGLNKESKHHKKFKPHEMLKGQRNTNTYSFLLGVFRGATPCLKIFILAPLLIIVELPLAFLMILVFATASTIYPIIGFLSASILTNLRKYHAYVQLTGAIVLISIGVFTIIKQLLVQNCPIGI